MEVLIDLLLKILTYVIFGVVAILVLCGVIYLVKRLVSRELFKKRVQNVVAKKGNAIIFVKLPLTNEQKEDAMEEFLHSLHRVMPDNTVFSFEIFSSNQFIGFYVVIPKIHKKLFESQLFAHYPDAELEEKDEYIPSFSNNNCAITEINFNKSSIYPIKTYKDLSSDLLKSFGSLLVKTDPHEEVFFQIVIRKVGSKFWQRGLAPIFFSLFNSKYEGEDKQTPGQQKLSQDLFFGKLRIAYLAEDNRIAEKKLNTLVSLFKHVDGSNKLRKPWLTLFADNISDAFKARLFNNGDFWSPAEIATIYHFLPYKGTTTSNVVKTTSKRAPAPDTLPREGVVNAEEVSFFGQTNYRNELIKFGIKRIDRRKHLYIVGKTGSGKSKLLELLIASDIQYGHGCCFLDPHGDSADIILKYIPKDRIEDVVYVNPADKDFPIGFNPLEPVRDHEARHRLAAYFISIFKKQFSVTWNDRMEHLIRFITLALLETPDSNVLGIERMLSDTQFRQRVIKQIQDPVVKSFWTNEFSSWNERFANDAVVPILNKVGQFISNPVIRNIVGQTKNSLDFERFMDEGKIIILNIAKGKLGDDNISLLGSMFITKIQQAALARAKIPEEKRRDFYFYVDEFQNFATDAFSTILSEARKYHLDLTIAHQYIAQLPPDVKASAFGNVGSLIVFAVGGDDAAYLTKEYLPVFSPEDLINLDNREMYVKMSIDGRTAQPFSARTIDFPKPQFDYSGEIIDRSRVKYGRNRLEVEREIEKWTNAAEAITTGSGKGKEDFPEPII